MKTCIKCGEPKELKMFSLDKRASDGVVSCCKLCKNKKALSVYYDDKNVKNREKDKKRKSAYNLKWKGENKKKIKKYNAEYRANNKSKIKEKEKEYNKNNKNKINKRQREYRKENKPIFDKYRPKRRLYEKIYAKENRDYINNRNRERGKRLTDGYVRGMWMAHNSGIKASDMPQDMIDFKRDQVILARKIKAQT